ncbi:hypothetical protein NY536_29325, partial [Enterobacter hormaechei]|nr:hypothetical protein [Enterobacter hormaechei]
SHRKPGNTIPGPPEIQAFRIRAVKALNQVLRMRIQPAKILNRLLKILIQPVKGLIQELERLIQVWSESARIIFINQWGYRIV